MIVSLDADFLYAGFPGSRVTRATLPSGAIPIGNMNRLYVVESTPIDRERRRITACRCGQSKIEGFARALAAALEWRSQRCDAR